MSEDEGFLFQGLAWQPYSRISLHAMAIEATRREGKTWYVSVAQVSEMLRHILDQLEAECDADPEGFAELMDERVEQLRARWIARA